MGFAAYPAVPRRQQPDERGEVVMAIKKSDLYSSLWRSCDELRGGMDASQYSAHDPLRGDFTRRSVSGDGAVL